jgi:type II secretory pathway pseudopilin PulG
MVVVAIIAILVSLTISKYSQRVAQARQAEAKIGLGSIYALEKSFYAEYSAYVPDLGAIGYDTEGFKRWYRIGWPSSGGSFTNTISGYSGGYNGPVCIFPQNNIWGTTCAVPVPGANASPHNVDDPQAFIAGAAGQLYSALVLCDNWTIDNLKILQHTQIGQ